MTTADGHRSVVLISAGRVVQIALSLVAVKVFTTLLTPAEVGNLYLLNAILGFFGFALVNPIGQYVNRHLHRWQGDGQLLNRFSSYNFYLVALSLFSVPVMYVLHFGFSVGSGVTFSTLALFVMVALYCTTWNTTLIPALNLLHHRGIFVALTVVTLGLGLGLSVAFSYLWGASAVTWLYGQSLAQLLLAAAALVVIARISGPRSSSAPCFRERFTGLGQLVGFALPLALTNVFMWSQNQSYRLIIENRLGLETLGFIAFGISLASNIANAAESILQQLHLPAFYRGINSTEKAERLEACNRYALLTIPAYFSLTLFTTCLAPFMVTILASRTFGDAFPFVIYGAWIELFRMVTNVLSNVAHSEMRTAKLLTPYLVGGVATVLLVWGATRNASAIQLVPAALLASGFVTMLLMYVNMRKVMKIRVGIRKAGTALLLSLPFAAVVPFIGYSRSLPVAVGVVVTVGLYFVFVQYRIARGVA